MKRLLIILLALLCLTGCNGSSTASPSPNSSKQEGTTSSSSSQTDESSMTDSNVLTEYESLIYNGISKVRVADICEFEVPEPIARQCIDIESAMDKMEKLNGSLEIDDITPDFWTSLFHDSGYFLNYHEVGMLMSEELLLQINLFKADASTPSMLNVLSDTEDVATFNSIFGRIVATSLYGSRGFSMLSRAGVVENDDVTLLSFIFACETTDFSLTDGYFGYFIIGYSSKSDTLMTCLISGLSGISDPELIGSVYNSFDNPSESEYWAILERRADE